MGSFFILFFIIFFFFFFNGAFGDIWTRTEMVEMAGYGEQKLSSVIITGSLLCDTSRPHLHSIAIPGATVAIKCNTGSKKRSKWIKVVTDEIGEFEIDLPSQLHAIPDLENTCFIKPGRSGYRATVQDHSKLLVSTFSTKDLNRNSRFFKFHHVKSICYGPRLLAGASVTEPS